MCTCMNFKTKDLYFGRTMDLDYSFNERVVVTPRNYEFKLNSGNIFYNKFAFIGAASVVDDYPLYAEATNEKGLSIAALQFPENAYYSSYNKEKNNITSFELIPWVLGNFSTIEELSANLNDLNITDMPFSSSLPVSPLHWMVCDNNDCIVLEQMKDGLKAVYNPIGILTNNPPFSYQLTNINNYMNLTPDISNNRFSDKIKLNCYSLGMGAIGLPGDNSSASRFVRAAFNKLNSVTNETEEESVAQFFHILDTVIVVRGTTMTEGKKWNMTTYTCCMNTNKGIYYYKTYNNSQITAIKLNNENINSDRLTLYDLVDSQQINYLN